MGLVGRAPAGPVAAENIRHLQDWPRHSRRIRPMAPLAAWLVSSQAYMYRKPHMGISESRGKKSLVHELRLRCLFRYPRSKPDSVIWLFLARSTSHPVVAQSDCTNIPLAAGGAQEDETILNCGFSGHGFRRFVHLDPPGLTVLED